jgi:DNA polymerase III delta subunit
MTLKNILLFRGENTLKLQSTVRSWREKFIQKHGEMNLMEIRDDNISDGILADCLSPGFMGGTRMVIFYEQLIKTQKQQDKIAEEEKASETVDLNEVFNAKKTNE